MSGTGTRRRTRTEPRRAGAAPARPGTGAPATRRPASRRGADERRRDLARGSSGARVHGGGTPRRPRRGAGDTGGGGGRDEQPVAVSWRRRGLWLAAAAAVVALVAALSWGPLQTYRQQQAETADAEAELTELDRQIAELDERVRALGEDETIEQIARDDFNLVLPGQEAFRLLPEGPAPVPVPDAWPFSSLRHP